MKTMIEVSQEEFFREVRRLTVNVHPSILPGRYPYTSSWRYNDGSEFGRSGGEESRYYLAKEVPHA